jgi:hypothetical protein
LKSKDFKCRRVICGLNNTIVQIGFKVVNDSLRVLKLGTGAIVKDQDFTGQTVSLACIF